MFLCGVARSNGHPNHYHETVAEISVFCRTPYPRVEAVPVAVAPAVPSVPAATAPGTPYAARSGHSATSPGRRTVRHADAPPTDAQIDLVSRLKGDVMYAMKLKRGACSDYIDSLRKGGSSVPAAPRSEIGIPAEFLKLIRPGYYATRISDSDPYTFFRVSIPTSGTYKDAIKIQTQHSDDWKMALVLWPSGKMWVPKPFIRDHVLLLIANQDEARRAYSKEIGSCQICNKTLTDERSRWYGIGPDCETRHAYVIDFVDTMYGEYTPGR